MKNIYSVLCILILAVNVSAQEITQTIIGNIIDKESRQPLIGATIQVTTQKNIGTVSDANGNFRIQHVPIGRNTIKITYLGYNDAFVNDIIINSAKEIVLNIEMIEKVVNAKEIIVQTNRINKSAPNNELIMISGRSFTIDQTMRYAGGFGDPSRMASSFAGVAGGGSDQRNDIVIRGNSPMGLLWRFEGADIPNPNHFSNQGANGGPVSILNNNLLANSDFITGAFPAEYGNANAGVFDLKMRNGNPEKHEFLGQIGFGGVEFMSEGPFSKKSNASYLISYRYSTLSFFDKVGIKFGNSGIPNYQDLSFKLNFPTQKGLFSIFGIGGLSSTQLLDSKKEVSEFKDLAFPMDVDFSSKMGVIGLSYTKQLDKRTYIKSVLSTSGESNRTKIDTVNSDINYLNRSDVYYLNRNTETARISLHSFINRKINARSSLKIGVILTRHISTMTDSSYVNAIHAWYKNLDFNADAFQTQAYLNWNYKITNELSVNSGVHLNYLHSNQTSSIDPRMSLKWQFTPRQSLSIGTGIHSQIQPLLTYNTRTLIDTLNQIYTYTNKNLGMNQALHLVLGYENMLNDNIRFKVETYYQHLYNLPISQNVSSYSSINFGADFYPIYADSLVNKGLARNYGIEFTLERFFTGSYYFLITGSLYNSEYLASDNIWRNTVFNGNFVWNALAGKEWKTGKQKNNVLALNMKVTYAGGRRYVPINEQASSQLHYAVYDYAHAYDQRFKNYFRSDLKISFRQNRKRFAQEWALEINNVFNIQNILTTQWNPRLSKMQELYQIGVFPVPFYRIYF